MLPVEWGVLTEHLNSLCNLPHNCQLNINKLKIIPHLLNNNEEQLSKLIPISSTNSRKINEKFLTYLLVKLCYNRSGTGLVRLCDVMDELIDPISATNCVQQIRHGMYIYLYYLC